MTPPTKALNREARLRAVGPGPRARLRDNPASSVVATPANRPAGPNNSQPTEMADAPPSGTRERCSRVIDPSSLVAGACTQGHADW